MKIFIFFQIRNMEKVHWDWMNSLLFVIALIVSNNYHYYTVIIIIVWWIAMASTCNFYLNHWFYYVCVNRINGIHKEWNKTTMKTTKTYPLWRLNWMVILISNTHTQEYRYEFNFDKYTRLKQTHREKEKMKESIENLFSSPSSSSSSSLLIKRQMANDE